MNNIPLNKIPSQLPVANRLSSNTITKPAAGIPFHEILKNKQAAVTSELSFQSMPMKGWQAETLTLVMNSTDVWKLVLRRLMKRE